MTHTCPYCGKGFEHNGGGKPRKTCGSRECKKANSRARRQTEEYKACKRAYRQTEKRKAYKREYLRQQRNAATINEMFRIITQAQESRP